MRIIVYKFLEKFSKKELKEKIMFFFILFFVLVGGSYYYYTKTEKDLNKSKSILKSLKAKKYKKIFEVNSNLLQINKNLDENKALLKKIEEINYILNLGKKSINSKINKSKEEWYDIASFINKQSVIYNITINNLENLKLLNNRSKKIRIKEINENTKDIIKVNGRGYYYNVVKFINQIEIKNKFIYIDYLKLTYNPNRNMINFEIIVKLNKEIK